MRNILQHMRRASSLEVRDFLTLGIIVSISACGSSAAAPTGVTGGGGALGTGAGSGGMNIAAAGGGVDGGASSLSGASGAGAMGGAAAGAGAAGDGAAGGGAAGGNQAGAAGASGTGGASQPCQPPADVFSPIQKLSQTGCVDASDPRKPVAGAVAYEVNSPLWSDSADKTRAFFLPPGATIHVRNCVTNAADCPAGVADDGRWDFPLGTVMIKTFMFDAKLVETRLFMRLQSGDWIGYSYGWDEAQTDATLVSSDGAALSFNTGTRSVPWHYPSQDDCLNCHNRAAGSTLGPETAQMNRVVAGVNQIDKLTALGVFETPPVKPFKAALVAPYAPTAGAAAATTEQKARSYLHANCAFCHKPGGNFANFDLRYDTLLKDTSTCNADVKKGAIANAPGKTKILVPGHEMDSVLWLRMNEPDPQKGRMPQIASYQVDASAVTVVGDWIHSLTACPQ